MGYRNRHIDRCCIDSFRGDPRSQGQASCPGILRRKRNRNIGIEGLQERLRCILSLQWRKEICTLQLLRERKTKVGQRITARKNRKSQPGEVVNASSAAELSENHLHD